MLCPYGRIPDELVERVLNSCFRRFFNHFFAIFVAECLDKYFKLFYKRRIVFTTRCLCNVGNVYTVAIKIV